ncbi:MAG: hypothetical protein ACRC7S_13955 [Cetobacterium sp.]
MEDLIARQKIEKLQDELRDYNTKFVRRDDLEYKRTVERVEKHSEEITEMKALMKNFQISLEKNTNVTETVNIRNAKMDVTLVNLNENFNRFIKDSNNEDKEIKSEIKEISDKMNKIDMDTSKNTDSRTNIKHLALFIATTLISLAIGGILATPIK